MFDRLNLRIGGALLVLGGAAFAWSLTRPPPDYYRFVDEVVGNTKTLRNQRAHLRVQGCVARGSLSKAADRPLYRFRLEQVPERAAAQGAIDARYAGVLPDLFRPGIRVIAAGVLTEDGHLEVDADGIITTCPGKFEGPGPHVVECPPWDS